ARENSSGTRATVTRRNDSALSQRIPLRSRDGGVESAGTSRTKPTLCDSIGRGCRYRAPMTGFRLAAARTRFEPRAKKLGDWCEPRTGATHGERAADDGSIDYLLASGG